MLSTYSFHITAGSGPLDGKRTCLSGAVRLETSDSQLQALETASETADEFYSQLLLCIERAFDASGQPEPMDPDECMSHI
ncbi:hypothetical protein JZU54_01955 [bacterium]|nr:hypothetical protein [bacterium]